MNLDEQRRERIARLIVGVRPEEAADVAETIDAIYADAIASLRKEREWQPIESAPKDGTPIIAFPDKQIGGVLGGVGWTVARYREGWVSGGFSGTPNKQVSGWWEGGLFMGPQPTHWQPLPEGPSS